MAAGIERGVEEYSLRGLGGFCVGLEDLLRQAHRRIEYSSPQFAEYIVDRLGIALQALSAIIYY